MSVDNLETILCLTVLVETSPQALPLGAACIASALKHKTELADFDVVLESYSLESKINTPELVAENILEKYSNLKIVCFSVYVWNRHFLEKVAFILKKSMPGLVCVAGGPEVTAYPSGFEYFDYMIAGEGERAVPELICKLIKNRDFCIDNEQYVPGFAFGIQGVYQKTCFDTVQKKDGCSESELAGFRGQKISLPSVVRAVPPDVSLIESPWLDGTIDPSLYGGALWELARGCPFKCSYCYESKGEKKIQYFPMERLSQELDFFARKKIAQIFVLDPTYNASKKKAIEMLKLIKKKAPDIFFYFEARAEFIDKELAQAFSSVSCCLQFGLQSSNPEVLAKVNRTLNKKEFVKNIGFLNDAGVVFGFDLIYGLPGDNLAGFKNSIDFAVSLYPNNIELFCLCVLPGTDLYEKGTNLGLTWQKNSPYLVVHNESFKGNELEEAGKLARAVNIFYTQGRAVPWFNSICYPLHQKPSVFFWEFAQFLEDEHVNTFDLDHKNIEELQKKFVSAIYKKKHLDRLLCIAMDLISLNGALSRCTADCVEDIVSLSYHPDDVMSEYASDLNFFAANAKKEKCRAKVFVGKFGADWKKIV